jgi:hypothetical protein
MSGIRPLQKLFCETKLYRYRDMADIEQAFLIQFDGSRRHFWTPGLRRDDAVHAGWFYSVTDT